MVAAEDNLFVRTIVMAVDRYAEESFENFDRTDVVNDAAMRVFMVRAHFVYNRVNPAEIGDAAIREVHTFEYNGRNEVHGGAGDNDFEAGGEMLREVCEAMDWWHADMERPWNQVGGE